MANLLLEPSKELEALIHQEEKRIARSLPAEKRFGLMEIARAMDYHWVRGRLNLIKVEEAFEVADLVEFGVNRAIRLCLDESTKFPLFPLTPSLKPHQEWSDSVLQICGRLGRCEHLLELCRLGLGELIKERTELYRFRYAEGPIGLESFEREDAVWFERFVASLQQAEILELNERVTRISVLQSAMVERWGTHYIQYDACPEVDEHFEREGRLHAQRMFGHDSFPGNASFGGKPFAFYCEVLSTLIGWSLKHLGFSVELLKKYDDLDPRNIITIPQDIDRKAQELAAALEVEVEVVRQAMDVTTLSLDNVNQLCAVPGNFVAPAFIQCGAERIIYPIWGYLSHPFQTMLDELKRKYRSDWDRSVDRREVHFREELYNLFKSDRFENLHKRVNLHIDGRLVTDVDAVILDRKTGTVALFQLKWQDTFRHSLRARESRKRNIQTTGNQWVDRVSAWLSEKNLEECARSLGLRAEDARRVQRFVLIVVGRNGVHFSGSGTLDSRAAWGNWYQILRIVVEAVDPENPLDEIYNQLIEKSPLKRSRPVLNETEIRVGDSRIIIEGTAIRFKRHEIPPA